MDTITLSSLELSCIIGTLPAERTSRQPVFATVELGVDLTAAGRSDALTDTVDYQAIENEIFQLAERTEHALLERLAADIAEVCLAQPLVQQVRVELHKPDAPVRSVVTVSILRRREQ